MSGKKKTKEQNLIDDWFGDQLKCQKKTSFMIMAAGGIVTLPNSWQRTGVLPLPQRGKKEYQL